MPAIPDGPDYARSLGATDVPEPFQINSQGQRYGEVAIAAAGDQLEILPNPFTATDYLIRWTFPEFTCKCPRSGYPDFATIHLWVLPDQHIVELKSLKLWLNSFRDVGVFHEEVAPKLLATLTDAMQPKWARIYVDFSPRGNLHTGISAVYQNENEPPSSLFVGGQSAWQAM